MYTVHTPQCKRKCNLNCLHNEMKLKQISVSKLFRICFVSVSFRITTNCLVLRHDVKGTSVRRADIRVGRCPGGGMSGRPTADASAAFELKRPNSP